MVPGVSARLIKVSRQGHRLATWAPQEQGLHSQLLVLLARAVQEPGWQQQLLACRCSYSSRTLWQVTVQQALRQKGRQVLMLAGQRQRVAVSMAGGLR